MWTAVQQPRSKWTLKPAQPFGNYSTIITSIPIPVSQACVHIVLLSSKHLLTNCRVTWVCKHTHLNTQSTMTNLFMRCHLNNIGSGFGLMMEWEGVYEWEQEVMGLEMDNLCLITSKWSMSCDRNQASTVTMETQIRFTCLWLWSQWIVPFISTFHHLEASQGWLALEKRPAAHPTRREQWQRK